MDPSSEVQRADAASYLKPLPQSGPCSGSCPKQAFNCSRDCLCFCLVPDRQVLLSERGFEKDPLT